MRYISPFYDEKFLVRKLAQMRLTGDTRILEPLHDRRGLAAAAHTTSEAELTSAAQLRTIMQSLGLSRSEAINVHAASLAQQPTSSGSLTTLTLASRNHRRQTGRKRTATGSAKLPVCPEAPKQSIATNPTAPTSAGGASQVATDVPFHSLIALVAAAPTKAPAPDAVEAATAVTVAAPISTSVVRGRHMLKASQKSLVIAVIRVGCPVGVSDLI